MHKKHLICKTESNIMEGQEHNTQIRSKVKLMSSFVITIFLYDREITLAENLERQYLSLRDEILS